MPSQAEHTNHSRSEVYADFWNPTPFLRATPLGLFPNENGGPAVRGNRRLCGLGLVPAPAVVVVAPVVPAVIPVLVVVAPAAVVVAVPAPATLAAAVGTVGREHVSYSHCGIPFPPRWGTDIPRRPPACRIAAQGQRGF